MNLDFRNCKTPEEVKEVFEKQDFKTRTKILKDLMKIAEAKGSHNLTCANSEVKDGK